MNKSKQKDSDDKKPQGYYIDREAAIKRSIEYYNTHKDKLNKKIICECSGKYTFKNKSTHLKSKMHQIYLAGKKAGGNNGKKINNSSDSSSNSDTDTSSDSDE